MGGGGGNAFFVEKTHFFLERGDAVDVALGVVTDVLPSGPPRRSGDESEAVHVVDSGFCRISAFLH